MVGDGSIFSAIRENTRGETGTETSDPFAVPPFSTSDIAVHTAGGLVNLTCLVLAVRWLAAHSSLLLQGWYWTIAALVLGTYVADFVSGLLHWAFDTWFSEDWTPVRRMVLLVREHHIHPNRIFRYRLWHDAGVLSWFAFLVSAPIVARILALHTPAAPFDASLVLGAVVASLEIVFMLEFHKCGHRLRRPTALRALQRMQMLLSPGQHLPHHSGFHDRNYCLITGIFDRTAGRLGAWRLLESLVSHLTGWVPRDNDRVWLRRYGRLPAAQNVCGLQGGGAEQNSQY
jgi:ubiquitin-conjugating enzyme E2 variant